MVGNQRVRGLFIEVWQVGMEKGKNGKRKKEKCRMWRER